MEERNLDEINLLTGSESRSYPVALLYSIADAYEALLNNTPDELSRDIVKKTVSCRTAKGKCVSRSSHNGKSYE